MGNKREEEGNERSYPLGCTIVAEAVLATPVHPTAHGNPGARVERGVHAHEVDGNAGTEAT